MFSLSSFILTGPVWFDVARARTCLGLAVVIILRSLVLGLLLFDNFFLYIICGIKWLWWSAKMFDSNILLNFYNEIANRSALQLARWGFCLFTFYFIRCARVCGWRRSRSLYATAFGVCGRVGLAAWWVGRYNLVSNERTICRFIRLSPSPVRASLYGEVNRFTLDGGLRNGLTELSAVVPLRRRCFSWHGFARIHHANFLN